MTRGLLASGVVMAASVLVYAQQEPQAPPLFRSTVDLVAVDVTVVDEEGRQIDDLQPEDFVLEVDGKPRDIVSAQFISRTDIDIGVPEPPVSYYSSNEEAGVGRLIMLVVDQAHILRGSGRNVLAAAARFLDHLSATDRVALAVIPSPGIGVNFTSNHDLIRQGLQRVVGTENIVRGRFSLSVEEAVALDERDQFRFQRAIERECRTEEIDQECSEFLAMEANLLVNQVRNRTGQSVEALKALIQGLSALEGPKSLIYVSEGLITSRGMPELGWLPAAAARAQVTLYAAYMDLPSLDTSARPGGLRRDPNLQRRGLEGLAAMTRGAVFRVSGRGDVPFQRIARELSGEYLLSFEPQEGERDGKPRKIEVDVRRDDVTVRARPEFRIERPEPTAAVVTDEERLTEMLRAPLPAVGLPLRITCYTVLDPPTQKAKLIIVSEIDRGATRSEELTVQFVIVDRDGRLTARSIDRVTAQPLDEWRPSRLYHTKAFLVDQGPYLVKAAVIDGTGRGGSVDHQVDARLTRAGRLRVGDLILSEVMNESSGVFRPRIDLDADAEAIATYIELYANDELDLIEAEVMLEIAADAQSDALVDQVATVRPTGDERIYTADAALPTGLLPHGYYVARAVVSVAGQEAGRVTRPFRVGPITQTTTLEGPGATPAGLAEGSAAPPAGGSTRVFDLNVVMQPEIVGSFLDRLVALQGEPPSAFAKIALDHARAGRFDEILTDALANEPQSLVAFLRGLGALADGRLERAAAEFLESLKRSEAYPAMFYLGACYAAGGRDREAVGTWQTALVTERQSPIIFAVLADALERLQDHEQAVVILREASQLWPDDAGFRQRLATAYVMTDRAGEGLQTLAEHLDRHPADRASLFLTMQILSDANRQGLPILGPAEDLEAFDRYARLYQEAGGPDQDLVSRWRQAFAPSAP